MMNFQAELFDLTNYTHIGYDDRVSGIASENNDQVGGSLSYKPQSTGPSLEEIKKYTPEELYKNYKLYYDLKHQEYEHALSAMGRMEPKNRDIPADIYNNIIDILRRQYYITAKPEANPHQYCLRRSWKGDIPFTSVVETIRQYGYVEWFWKKPYMMLNVGEFKYWTMGYDKDITILINRTLIKPCTKEDLKRRR
jgi:hypothetical protein